MLLFNIVSANENLTLHIQSLIFQTHYTGFTISCPIISNSFVHVVHVCILIMNSQFLNVSNTFLFFSEIQAYKKLSFEDKEQLCSVSR